MEFSIEILNGPLVELIIIILIAVILVFVRKVPKNTAIIIDRCTHYCKTAKRGIYIMNPWTDKITTKISTNVLTKYYSEVYETHDAKFIRINYNVSYNAPSIDAVLDHLAADRRSIDDIIKCSVASTVKGYTANVSKAEIKNEAFNRMALNCSPFGIEIKALDIVSMYSASKDEVFKPHVHKDDGPIKY